MKFTLQIAVGVFLGTLASQLIIESWHAHKLKATTEAADQRAADQEQKVIAARRLLMHQFQKKIDEDSTRRQQSGESRTEERTATDGSVIGLPPGMPTPTKRP